jgi:hypothetical protein
VQQYYSQPLRFSTEDALSTSLNVTGLQPDTKYKVQVRGCSWLSPVVFFFCWGLGEGKRVEALSVLAHRTEK